MEFARTPKHRREEDLTLGRGGRGENLDKPLKQKYLFLLRGSVLRVNFRFKV
jgi:hypothetical protein